MLVGTLESSGLGSSCSAVLGFLLRCFSGDLGGKAGAPCDTYPVYLCTYMPLKCSLHRLVKVSAPFRGLTLGLHMLPQNALVLSLTAPEYLSNVMILPAF